MSFNRFATRRALNIDITFRCPLQCPNCPRQARYARDHEKVPGHDISLEDMERVTDHFNQIQFSGQLSDPTHHPKFIEILEMCYRKKIDVTVSNASSSKPMRWYQKAFEANPDARWIFGIDGLPEESHIYRVNQDGVKLYNVMLEARKTLNAKPIWQYIIFKYNEDHIEQAQQMAMEADVRFMYMISSRWEGEDDPLMPTNIKLKLPRKF